MNKKLSLSSSLLVSIASVLLFASLFFPWWGMQFIAPQYPEGLDIIVYPNKLEGQIEIINGLNHYIGMKEFSEKNFPELNYLPYIIGGLALLVLGAGWWRRWKGLAATALLYAVGGVLGVYDIHRWLKDFGTNLDPKAPIKIDPFIPPIYGENQIANFITHSYFSTGSFLLGASFLLILWVLWKERKRC
ncbi:hypothetical protein [Ammoniphilus sp. CFH 90114]|uniref:hypothetical protein n=1 Tax=Ammoniphilus sp. CFH 90114 TaxID=2493665 RepID=UPI00100DDCD6|nr:hypothetical protein [Ammoniphilus sp. CFH 90114]RXT03791.1 hypothetical protein EIZ39_22690 [Ammoniphilus sp. CFH 90114]